MSKLSLTPFSTIACEKYRTSGMHRLNLSGKSANNFSITQSASGPMINTGRNIGSATKRKKINLKYDVKQLVIDYNKNGNRLQSNLVTF